MKIKAFKALRPAVENVGRVASPPYDVVDTEEARAMAEGNPMCFLRISRAELELAPGTDLYSEPVYARAVANFKLFQEKGYLKQDASPALYLYRQTMGAHTQIGLTAVCHVDDYDQDLIKKHEKTRKAPEEDRTRYNDLTNANLGLVFLAYRDRPEIDAAVNRIRTSAPLYDFTAADGVRHTVWRVPDPKLFVDFFAKIPNTYIADGHHRASAAARVGRLRRQANPIHTGAEEYNWFLAVLFPAGQLQILPYNRVVKSLNGMTSAQFLEAIRARGIRVTPGGAPKPTEPHKAGLYLQGAWYELSWDAPPSADPVASLDVSVVQDRILAPLLGIDDPRASPNIEFVGGIRGVEELARRVDSGRGVVAFSLYPVSLDQLMAIADAGQVMPPKSTWFEPKLRSGILVHKLDD